MVNIAVGVKVPGNFSIFYFCPRLTHLPVSGRFLRQKKFFEGLNFWSKPKKTNQKRKLTNLFKVLNPKSPQKSTDLLKKKIPNILPYTGSPKSVNYGLGIFWRFLTFGPFLAVFRYRSLKCKI